MLALNRNYVDRVKSDRIGGRWRVQFHLEHRDAETMLTSTELFP